MTNHNNKPQQLPALTGLRGIAAMGIVLHHYTAYLFPATGAYIQQYSPFLLKNYLWVDFFFTLSGFVLMHVYQQTFTNHIKPKDYFTFLKARLARIYPLHIITLAFLVCLELARLYIYQEYGTGDLYHLPFTGKRIEAIFSNIFLLQAFHDQSYWNEPAWAISAEWLLYLVVPLLIFFTRYTNKLVNTGILLFGFSALYLLASHNNGLDFCTWRSLVRCSAEVTIGILAYKLSYQQQQANILSNKPWLSSFLLALALLSMALPINHVITVAVFALLICTAATLGKHCFLTHQLVLFLGTISYSIYMIHWCVRDILQMLSFSFTGQNVFSNIPASGQWWALFLTTLLTLVLSTGCYIRIEKPLREKINRLKLHQHSEHNV